VDFVCYDCVVSVVEYVEEPAVPCESHVEISASDRCRFGVEQRDFSVASNGVGRYGGAVGVGGVGELAVLGYDEPACCLLSVRDMSNSASGNQVIVYTRAADGTLTWKANYATNGLGITGLTGSNQGGLVLSEDGRWLIVVNAGSNDISVFSVNHKGLTLTDRTSSQGTMPISLTVHGSVVYVLNSGGAESTSNIAGFALSDGQLSEISGSVQPLSGVTAPAQISFNPTGTVLVVTEKSTSKIDTFLVNSEGVASAPNVQSSSGGTPFGFDFAPSGTLIVSEAAGGPSGTSAVSSYTISDSGSLTTLSASVM